VEQKINILVILIASIGGFIFFRNKDKDFHSRDKVLFVLGVILATAGIFFVLIVHDFQIMIQCVTLNTQKVSGKLILVGYILMIMGICFFIDKLLNKRKIGKG